MPIAIAKHRPCHQKHTDRPVRRLRQVLRTPCSRVTEKLVKKFPAFYGTRRFIIVFTRHPPPLVPYTEPDQSSPQDLLFHENPF
jgi:hypothetical protein